MTEKEKMLKGENYNASDEQLFSERTRCKNLLYDFNHSRPTERTVREEILREILGSVGEGTWIEPPFACDYGAQIRVGKKFYANHNCVMLDCAEITFGDNVFVGPNCCFTTAEHPLDAATRNTGLESARPICVGNDVWIGAGVVVLPGVKIGDGCVIGAGSVVTRDIPAGTIAFGNPCRVRRSVSDKK